MKVLYIFVTSDRPDQYLNPIVYCLLKGVNRIVFVQITRPGVQQIQINTLCRNVFDLIYNLSAGIYKYYIGINQGKEVSLDTRYSPTELADIKATYKLCLSNDIKWDTESFEYSAMKQAIASLNKRGKNNIFDITSFSKSLMGDIIACCLLENIQELYTFELIGKLNFSEPWTMLIHKLKEQKDYKYINIVKTSVFQESAKQILIRTTPLIISIISTITFVILALAATFILGESHVVSRLMNTVGIALGIVSFFLIFFPIRGN